MNPIRRIKLFALLATAFTMMLFGGTLAYANQQIILVPDPGGALVMGDPLDIAVNYECPVNTGALELTIHYDSTKLAPQEPAFSEFFADAMSLTGTGPVFENDTENTDNDADTDKMITFGFAEITRNFPTQATLAILHFQANAAKGQTRLNIVQVTAAPGQRVTGVSLLVTFGARITATSKPAEGGSVSPSQTWEYGVGETPTYTITVTDGYEIGSFAIDDVDAQADLEPGTHENEHTYTFPELEVGDNITLSVVFTPVRKYVINASVGEGYGTLSPGGLLEYEEGDAPPVFAVTPITHYEIDTFFVSTDPDAQSKLEPIEDAPDAFTYSFETLTDAQVSVSFKKKAYKVTTLTGVGGSVEGGEYEALSAPLFTISPAPDYEIDEFKVNDLDVKAYLMENEDGTSTYTVASLTGDAVIHATFKKIQHTVTPLVMGEGGTITPEMATAYDVGEDVEIEVIPEPCYEVDTFVQDDQDAELTDNKYVIADLRANTEVTVTFKKIQYTVTPSVIGDGGTLITPAETTAYECGTDVAVEVRPDEGYMADVFTVSTDKSAELTDNTYTLANIQADTAIDVTFALHNESPVPADGTVSINIGDVKVSGALNADDPDEGDTVVKYEIVTQGTQGDVVVTDAGAFTYYLHGTVTVSGTDVFTFNVTDSRGRVSRTVGAITVTIDDPNHAPVCVSQPEAGETLSAAPGEILRGTLTANDPDEGDTVAFFEIVTSASQGEAMLTDAATGAFAYVSNDNAVIGSTDAFTFRATDTRGKVSETVGTITMTIDEPNNAPVCVSQPGEDEMLSVAPGGILRGTLTANDPDDGDTIAFFEIVRSVTQGIIRLTDAVTGAYVYVPDDEVGAGAVDAFTFRATDSRGKVSEVDGIVTMTIGEPVTYPVTASVNLAGGGTITPSGEMAVMEGEDVTFGVVVNEGYMLRRITDNGIQVELDAYDTYSITVTKAHEIVVTIEAQGGYHSADSGAGGDEADDYEIGLSELLRVVQFYTQGRYHCDPQGEDGYATGAGDEMCVPHDADYDEQDWNINLNELLRIIQFYNRGGYHADPESEDGFGAGK